MTYEITVTNKQSQTDDTAVFQKTPNVENYQSIAWKVQPPGFGTIDRNLCYSINPDYHAQQPAVADRPPRHGITGGIGFDANGNIQLVDIQIGSSFSLKPD